jgi:hypothetical protein
MLTPLLTQLIATAVARRDWANWLLATARATAHDGPLEVDSVTYLRHH